MPRLEGELAALSAAKENLSASLLELSAQKLATIAELAAAQEECFKLSSEKNALALRLEAIEATSAELALLQRELATISGQRDEASRARSELATENSTRAEVLSRAQDEIVNLIVERDTAQRLAEQFRAESENAGAQREALRGEVAALAAR